MASRYKTTGCARFFLFLLFFIPLVYFGLKYFDDRGQLDDWRAQIGLDNDKNAVEEILEQKGDSDFDVQQVKRQIADLLSKIETQDQIIKDQEETIAKQQKLIEQLSAGEVSPPETPEERQASPPKKGDPSLEELLKEADKALKKNSG